MRMNTAFVPPDDPTLGDVLTRIAGDPTIPERRRSELTSAIRSFARWAGDTPEGVPASPDYLRRKLATLHPATLGVSRRRLGNVKSLLREALERCGSIPRRRLYMADMTSSWRR